MNQKVLNILKVVVFSLLVVDLEAQQAEIIDKYSKKRQRLNSTGMTALTTWASINILNGAGYFVSKHPEERYFCAMNAGWGIVNLSIALPALVSKPKKFDSLLKLSENQRKTERIFLINGGLDLLYIGSGLYLNVYGNSQQNPDKKALFNGFGKSIILQGVALLIFDASMFLVNRKFRKKEIDKTIQNSQISIGLNGINCSYKF